MAPLASGNDRIPSQYGLACCEKFPKFFNLGQRIFSRPGYPQPADSSQNLALGTATSSPPTTGHAMAANPFCLHVLMFS